MVAGKNELEIRRATEDDIGEISLILTEAATWLESKGEKLWEADELTPEKIESEVLKGLFWLAAFEGNTAGCFRYQKADLEYWDDVPHEDSAFIHRVAVRRNFSGLGLSGAMIEWAKLKAIADGRRYLRLDCADRPKLRRVYEDMGFKFHSVKKRSPYFVIRYEFDLNRLV
ncbi:MAG: GNAT family N-acetyltransferase [Pyrinomonadaceae bacterium]|nr:GNAT family N-acetyltransferase [Pyrinomonadaceae bacterium]